MGMRQIYKTLNDPNRIITKMFKDADKLNKFLERSKSPRDMTKALQTFGVLSKTVPGSIRSLENINK